MKTTINYYVWQVPMFYEKEHLLREAAINRINLSGKTEGFRYLLIRNRKVEAYTNSVSQMVREWIGGFKAQWIDNLRELPDEKPVVRNVVRRPVIELSLADNEFISYVEVDGKQLKYEVAVIEEINNEDSSEDCSADD